MEIDEGKYIAHVRKKEHDQWDEPHYLYNHSAGTAMKAEMFAEKFKSGSWAKVIGWGHDAGKGREFWQEYLKTKSGYLEDASMENKAGRITHAIYGALLAQEILGKDAATPITYCIAGHHAGLPDGSTGNGAGLGALDYQLSNNTTKDVAEMFTEQIKVLAKDLDVPFKFSRDSISFSLWIRMLYSCLVDADYLDTESYMTPERNAERGKYCSITELLCRYNDFNVMMMEKSKDTQVNCIRRELNKKCIKMAEQAQGIFSLSVPTGGGKTLSSLAFALNHAVKHNLDRVIYVIPYMSIVEQTADVFRNVLGDDQVVEHHSNVADDNYTDKMRLATENWDAPVIVTTSVQFFESLFAAKPAKSRKLHNITKSVVVIDEAQLIPVEFLNPILSTIQDLTEHYGVTFVLSTATQPSFSKKISSKTTLSGLKQITEIMGEQDEVKSLYNSLKRVNVKIPKELSTPISWEDLAVELSKNKQVLCVVSTRNACRQLHGLMPEGTYHLSALMCGQHRSDIIREIKTKLAKDEPVRVISTNLIEAGVDLSFPVVYREIAGLDSIAQAAGRCNREGMITKGGTVVVFIPPKKIPSGILKKAADTTCSILRDTQEDVLSCEMFERYFEEYYWRVNKFDKEDLLPLLKISSEDSSIYFRTVAEKFKLIDDNQKSIIVYYGNNNDLIEELKVTGPHRVLMRKLQRYVVNVYQNVFSVMLSQDSIKEVHPGIFVLSSNLDYSSKIGLIVGTILYESKDLII